MKFRMEIMIIVVIFCISLNSLKPLEEQQRMTRAWNFWMSPVGVNDDISWMPSQIKPQIKELIEDDNDEDK